MSKNIETEGRNTAIFIRVYICCWNYWAPDWNKRRAGKFKAESRSVWSHCGATSACSVTMLQWAQSLHHLVASSRKKFPSVHLCSCSELIPKRVIRSTYRVPVRAECREGYNIRHDETEGRDTTDYLPSTHLLYLILGRWWSNVPGNNSWDGN